MTSKPTPGPVASPIEEERGFDFRSDSSQSGDSDGGGGLNQSTPTSPNFVQDMSSVAREGAPIARLGASLSHVHVEAPPNLNHPNTTRPASRVMESRSNSRIKDGIWALHADELVALVQRNRPSLSRSDPYYALVRKIIGHYFYFLNATWTRCAWSLLVLPGSKYLASSVQPSSH
jgi:hypothetical protein